MNCWTCTADRLTSFTVIATISSFVTQVHLQPLLHPPQHPLHTDIALMGYTTEKWTPVFVLLYYWVQNGQCYKQAYYYYDVAKAVSIKIPLLFGCCFRCLYVFLFVCHFTQKYKYKTCLITAWYSKYYDLNLTLKYKFVTHFTWNISIIIFTTYSENTHTAFNIHLRLKTLTHLTI